MEHFISNAAERRCKVEPHCGTLPPQLKAGPELRHDSFTPENLNTTKEAHRCVLRVTNVEKETFLAVNLWTR